MPVNRQFNFSKQPAVFSRGTGGGSLSAASFGTGWERPPMHPEPSDIVLVSEQRYAVDGGASSSIDPQGTVTSEQRDQAGRRIRLTENAGGETSQQRVSQFQYAPDGGLKRLILQNPTTGEQVTTWVYGTTLAASGIARNDLPVSKTYPTGESETQSYNRQGEAQTMTDPNGSVHGYRRDKLGKLTDDQITTLASEVDGLVRRISTTYDERGRVQLITSGSEPEPGAGTVINQTAYSYNGIDCLTKEAQSDSGVLDGSTPSVQYNCTGALDNVLRRTALVYPNGRTVSYEYGAAGSIDDVLNRVQSVHDDDLTVLAEFQYLGSVMPVVTSLPQPAIQRRWKKLSGQPDGDAGDPYTGYDRFGRTEQMQWWTTGGSPASLVNVQWGYNRASQKTWRKDLLAPGSTGQDQHFGYDGLNQATERQRGLLNINATAISSIPAQQENFRYDETGNWITYRQVNDGVLGIDETRVNNRSNQMTQVDGSSAGISYDANGNMLTVPTGEGLTA
jgi:YD repeat-containing protein